MVDELYKKWQGHAPVKIEEIAGAGSNRHYLRLYDADGNSVIGVVGKDRDENRSFVYLSRQFEEKGLPVPRVLAVSNDDTCYLQEDLGRLSLYDALDGARNDGYTYGEKEKALLEHTIKWLPHFQVEGDKGLDYERLLQPVHFDRRTILFDLHYFKYSFFKTLDLPFNEVRLEDDFESFAETLYNHEGEGEYFLYRDFQARNVVLTNDHEPRFIDFQGGRKGPLAYDLASFLWQASAHYPDTLREHLVHIYIKELKTLLPDLDEGAFRRRLRRFVLFRTLQVLGAYGLRGFVERKSYFLKSIPEAVSNLRTLADEGVIDDLPYLKETLERVCSLPRFTPAITGDLQPSTSKYDGKGRLVVRVFSFSYKKGIPTDESGNGGGYVFDCRSTHNPGRYEPYKPLTGRDEPVIRFLEEDGEILSFLESVYRLADAHVERYMKRGFTDLMFSFGCTGGRHRSVYSAEHLARRLNQKYGIEVRLCHREQGFYEVLNAAET